MIDANDILREQAKRDRHSSDAERRRWADELLLRLPDSLAYQQKCTRQARLKEQSELLQQLDCWQLRLENGSSAPGSKEPFK